MPRCTVRRCWRQRTYAAVHGAAVLEAENLAAVHGAAVLEAEEVLEAENLAAVHGAAVLEAENRRVLVQSVVGRRRRRRGPAGFAMVFLY